jgi:D-glycero-alpha-D-manno-heptose-7-phosphate kinase
VVFKASVPYRIGLIGGGTDLPFFTNEHGTELINASFKAFSHCEIHKIQSPHIFIETKDYQQQIQIDKLPELALIARDEFRIALAVLNYFADAILAMGTGLHIKSYSEFAPQTGLGGSSAHLISVLKACLNLIDLKWDDQKILETARELERDTLSIFGGFQDFYPCLYTGAHYLSKMPKSEIRHRTLNSDFLNQLDLSFYITGSTATALGELELPDLMSLKEQQRIAQEAANAWATADVASFKRLLRQSWNIKNKISESIPFVFASKTCGLSKKMKVLAVENSVEKSFKENFGEDVRKIEWH